MRIVGHHDEQYNGDYCHDGQNWGGTAHFVSASGVHFYNFNGAWQLDERDQPDPENLADYYDGGYLSLGGYSYSYWHFTDYDLFIQLVWEDTDGAN